MIGDLKNGSVRIGNTEMAYVSFGHGAKTLAVLPGLSDGLATVKGKALFLAGPYRRYADRYTVYMFSRKEQMAEDCSIEDMADDQAAAMKELGIEKASVMGVSQGGMIALCLALRQPELVEKLVAAVTAPNANSLIRDNVNRWIAFAKQGDHRQLMIDTAEKSYSDSYLKKIRKLYPVISRVGKPKDYKRFLINAEAILRFDVLDSLGEISCPTLIIGGAEDHTVGAEASRIMHERIPGSSLYLYEGLGHAAYEEAEDFYERVFSFLEA